MTATVIVMPPQPAPKALTANAPSANLRAHFLAFLAANNPRGFNPEVVDSMSADSIGALLLVAADRDSLRMEDFKAEAKKVKIGSGGSISHCQALELMSILFGFESWYEALKVSAGGRVANRRVDRAKINRKLFGPAIA